MGWIPASAGMTGVFAQPPPRELQEKMGECLFVFGFWLDSCSKFFEYDYKTGNTL
jgi:hypothetical protein